MSKPQRMFALRFAFWSWTQSCPANLMASSCRTTAASAGRSTARTDMCPAIDSKPTLKKALRSTLSFSWR